MNLNLNPDIEARLLALAEASGVSVEDFLRRENLYPDRW
jgi:hypothetical protein